MEANFFVRQRKGRWELAAPFSSVLVEPGFSAPLTGYRLWRLALLDLVNGFDESELARVREALERHPDPVDVEGGWERGLVGITLLILERACIRAGMAPDLDVLKARWLPEGAASGVQPRRAMGVVLEELYRLARRTVPGPAAFYSISGGLLDFRPSAPEGASALQKYLDILSGDKKPSGEGLDDRVLAFLEDQRADKRRPARVSIEQGNRWSFVERVRSRLGGTPDRIAMSQRVWLVVMALGFIALGAISVGSAIPGYREMRAFEDRFERPYVQAFKGQKLIER